MNIHTILPDIEVQLTSNDFILSAVLLLLRSLIPILPTNPVVEWAVGKNFRFSTPFTLAKHASRTQAFLFLALSCLECTGLASTRIPVQFCSLSSCSVLAPNSPSRAPASKKNPGWLWVAQAFANPSTHYRFHIRLGILNFLIASKICINLSKLKINIKLQCRFEYIYTPYFSNNLEGVYSNQRSRLKSLFSVENKFCHVDRVF